MASAASWILRKVLWLLALVFLATCVALIYESAQSGVSPLFAWANTLEAETLPAPLTAFVSVSGVAELVTLIHIILGTLASWAVVWACLRHGADNGMRTAGWLIPLAAVLMTFGAVAPLLSSSHILSTGWLEATGFSPAQQQTVSRPLFAVAHPMVQWPLLLVFCYAAAAILLATTKTERWSAVSIIFVAFITLALLVAAWIMAGVPFNQLARTAPLGLGLLAFVSVLQSDSDRPGHAHIWIGTAVTIAAGIYGIIQAAGGLSNPYTSVMMTMFAYTGPYAMVTFLGFAYLDMRWQPRLPRLLVWCHALGLAILAGLAFLPLGAPELRTIPMRDIDYPAIHDPTRFIVANAQALLLIWVLIGLVAMRRSRQMPAPGLPPLQAQSTEPSSPQAV